MSRPYRSILNNFLGVEFISRKRKITNYKELVSFIEDCQPYYRNIQVLQVAEKLWNEWFEFINSDYRMDITIDNLEIKYLGGDYLPQWGEKEKKEWIVLST